MTILQLDHAGRIAGWNDGMRTFMEIAYILGAAILLGALIYGVNMYRRKGDPVREAGEKVVKERYERGD